MSRLATTAIDHTLEAMTGALRAGLASYTQKTRLLRLHTPLGADRLIAERFDGIEHLSGMERGGSTAGFRFDLVALSTDAHLDPDALLGQPVLLELLCADSRVDLRPFHGHVTAFEQLGSNGSLACYRLTIEPWLAFLDHRRDSYVFQDRTVVEIIDEIFGDYAGEGVLIPAWRWQLADASVCPRRSLTVQYRESDLAFVLRLLAEAGLFGWFEHTGDVASASFGSHGLVIADANTAFAPDLGAVRFHRSDATESADSLQRLDATAAVGTQAVALTSWDYVGLDVRAVEQVVADDTDRASAAPQPALTWHDTPGLYTYADRDQGARRARTQARARVVSRQCVDSAGTLRRLAAGCRFTVSGHACFDAMAAANGPDAASFIALRVAHRARNNLPANFSQALDRLLGDMPFEAQPDDRVDAPLYDNAAVLLPWSVPYAPVFLRKPAAQGVQTAAVVGVDSASITTDRDHRVKVQFHWQRGTRSQSRIDHPAGSDNAPGNEKSGTWVRVAAPVAGANWGGVFVPRIGQEVVVEFIEGDSDRPVVIGSVYNGRGQDDAPGNAVGQTAPAASTNAPAWHAGNGHPGVLSGLKTQSLSSSQSGSGDYNQMLFDSTPAQARFDLATTQHRTQMMLGHQCVQDANTRAAPLGHGVSLATDAYGAIRSGEGLLISADAQAGGTHGGRQAFEATEAIQQLSEAETLAQALADTASKQNVGLAGRKAAVTFLSPGEGRSEGGPAGTYSPISTPAIAALQRSQTVLRGSPDTGTGLAWSEPMIAVSAPDGIVALTPDASLWSAGTHLSMTAAHSIETIAQGDHRTAVKDGIVLFTHGGKPALGAPETLAGLQLHGAQGPVSLQAQSGPATLAAQQEVRIASTSGSVTMQAKEQMLLTAQGAYIRLHDGNIEVHAPGDVSFMGASKRLAGAAHVDAEGGALPAARPIHDEQFVLKDQASGAPLPFTPYRIEVDDGQVLEGLTDAEGATARIYTAHPQKLKVFHG